MSINKKLIGITVCLACIAGFASAQEAPDELSAPQHEKRLPREVPNPEKIATRMTDEMQKSLQLTDKQYKKIYKLNLKEQKKQFKAMQNSDGQRQPMGEGPGMRGGGRPHMDGMGGGEPPMMGEGGFHGRNGGMGMDMGERAQMGGNDNAADTQKKAAEAREKKIKKILTKDQFEKWQTEQVAIRAKAPHNKKAKGEHPHSHNAPEGEML